MSDTKATTLLDHAAFCELLTRRIEQSGSQARWAEENGISRAYLNEVLKGRSDPGKKILDALGLESVTYYRAK